MAYIENPIQEGMDFKEIRDSVNNGFKSVIDALNISINNFNTSEHSVRREIGGSTIYNKTEKYPMADANGKPFEQAQHNFLLTVIDTEDINETSQWSDPIMFLDNIEFPIDKLQAPYGNSLDIFIDHRVVINDLYPSDYSINLGVKIDFFNIDTNTDLFSSIYTCSYTPKGGNSLNIRPEFSTSYKNKLPLDKDQHKSLTSGTQRIGMRISFVLHSNEHYYVGQTHSLLVYGVKYEYTTPMRDLIPLIEISNNQDTLLPEGGV